MMKKNTSEFRRDIISGDWILFAPGRAKRPEEFKKKGVRKRIPRSKCPFEQPFKNVDEHIILEYSKRGEQIARGEEKRGGDWSILVLQNKYPAVRHGGKRPAVHHKFLFEMMEGIGHHDLLITKDHDKNFPALAPAEAFHVLQAFRDRYLMLFGGKDVAYVSMFQNWGPNVGGSVYHPHYQSIAIPVVPPDIVHSLDGSRRYFKEKGMCPHCAMIRWELKEKKRILFETEHAIAFSPFVSRNAFEVRVFPKRHMPYFENTPDMILENVAHLLQKVLNRMKKNLGDPDYNFFIHTAPMQNKDRHTHYHWHIEVYPFFNVHAGFEMETGLTINPVDPDVASKLLRR